MNAAIERVDTLNRFPKLWKAWAFQHLPQKKSVNDLAGGSERVADGIE